VKKYIQHTTVSLLSVAIIGCAACATPKTERTSVIKDHELKGEQYRAWQEIRNYWFKNIYRECLRSHNLKMSCSGCEYIYIRVVITIDRKGKMVSCEMVGERVCIDKASESLESCFTDYFRTLTFPRELRGLRFETMLGTGLTC
jgi:hypothetical protein